MKRIVVYGGSFNPPLNSHFAIAQGVLNQFPDIEKIIFIPLNKKYGKDGMIEDEHRYNMLKSVIDKNDLFELSDIDIKSDHSLFSYQHLRKIKDEFPGREISFLIGSDNLKDIKNWERPNELLSDYKVLVMERDADNIKEIIENDILLKEHENNIVMLRVDIKSNYNSTYVRNLLKDGKSIRYLVPDEVYNYIKENELYRM